MDTTFFPDLRNMYEIGLHYTMRVGSERQRTVLLSRIAYR